MGDALEALRIVAILASPALPQTCQTVWERLGLDGRVDDATTPGQLPRGAAIRAG